MKTTLCAPLICVMTLAAASATVLLPNPKTNYMYCSRPGPSRICDPDGVLTSTGADFIEQVLNDTINAKAPYVISPCSYTFQDQEAPGFEVGVAIRMNMLMATADVGRGFEEIAPPLFPLWGIGGAVCQSGVLVLVDANTSRAQIFKGLSAVKWISDDNAAAIIDNSQGLLDAKRFDDAVKQIVTNVGLCIAGQDFIHGPIWWQRNGDTFVYLLVFVIIPFLAACVICCVQGMRRRAAHQGMV